jgi:hypothetical protein
MYLCTIGEGYVIQFDLNVPYDFLNVFVFTSKVCISRMYINY